ncbi:glutaminyl-peptide cyclotransferase-like [Styela clava]
MSNHVLGLSLLSMLLACSCLTFTAANLERGLSAKETEWYNAKRNWTLRSLKNNEIKKITGFVNIKRLQNNILPYLLVTRPSGTSNIEYVRRIIITFLQLILGWTVELDTFVGYPPYPHRPTSFTNIIATYNPRAERRLVLACHYDSKRTPMHFIGATDSAVPCGMLIEIAVVLRNYLDSSFYKKNLTLQLIFFDGEEAFGKWTDTDSLYGSRHLAKKWHNTRWPLNNIESNNTMLDAIDLLALLDLLGSSNPKFYNNRFVKSEHFADLIRIEKEIFGVNLYFKKKIANSYVEDDHIPFYTRNVPVLHVIPSPFPWHWHTLQDNMQNLDFTTIERLTKIFVVFVSEYLHLDIL